MFKNSDVADRADVSAGTAREYLAWFADLGILEQVADSPALYERNEAYFRWRRIQRLAAQSDADLLDRLEELTRQERAFSERFDASGPWGRRRPRTRRLRRRRGRLAGASGVADRPAPHPGPRTGPPAPRPRR